MQYMYQRWITDKLKAAIKRYPAVALLGPRQVGKTTLAHLIAKQRDAVYLDLESPADQMKLRDPLSFLSSHGEKLIILDEIQRVPDLFMSLRGLIDENRRAGRSGEQFLLLGSASMDLLKQSSESLAGRICYIGVSGFNLLEVNRVDGGRDDNSIRRLWFRGGFPESFLSHSDWEGMEWLDMFVRTYLERDLPQFGIRIPAARLRRLWIMLAHLQGENVNYSKLAANLEVDSKTVSHYLDILVDLLLVRRLLPWHTNVKKRLVKSPRFYIRDSGIVHHLLGITDSDSLLSNPVLGKSWEGFVIENILSILPDRVVPHYYRTASGAEIDLVLNLSSEERWAIEIKYGLAPKIPNGFHIAAADVQATRKLIVYSGQDEYLIEKNTTVISLYGIMKILQNAW